jgi:cell division protein FtsZ
LNVTGSEDNLNMYEIQEVSGAVYDWLDYEQATIIWGATIDDSLRDRIRVSILLGE